MSRRLFAACAQRFANSLKSTQLLVRPSRVLSVAGVVGTGMALSNMYLQPSLVSAAPSKGTVKDIKLEEKSFLALLSTLIGYTEQLQNNPPALVPKEDLVADAVIAYLAPYTAPNGPLEVKKVTYVEGRSNLVIKYKATNPTDKWVNFVGSHMDVVAANPADWNRNPFKLTVDGDTLWGRGVTDCLGHVALLANFFKQLAEKKPNLNVNVSAVFIANEEHNSSGVGIDEMQKKGELEFCKGGPVYWMDSANFGPTLGTGGMQTWELTVTGKLFHSGLPHQAINPINLANDAMRYIQERFHEDFAAGEAEKRYLFAVGSSLKPTQITTPPGSINQIPLQVSVKGDIRITPFHSAAEVKKKVESYVETFNRTLKYQKTLGYDRYELPQENRKGKVELKWLGDGMTGIAVKLDSPGHKALVSALEKVRGKASPFSITGSLPLVGELQQAGLDVQMTGFGRMEAYHAINEFGKLSEFAQGAEIVADILNTLSNNAN